MKNVGEVPHLVASFGERLKGETGFSFDLVASNVHRYPPGRAFVRLLDPQGIEVTHTDNFADLIMFAQGIIEGWRAGAVQKKPMSIYFRRYGRPGALNVPKFDPILPGRLPAVIVCNQCDEMLIREAWLGCPTEIFTNNAVAIGHYLCLDGDMAKAFIEGRSVNPVCQEDLEKPV